MNILELSQKIINGKRLSYKDDLSILLTAPLKDLCTGADKIRAAFVGNKVDLCAIINGKGGRCPENCAFCAQSARHATNCTVHDFLPIEQILSSCAEHEREGVDRFSIVTAGKSLSGADFEKAVLAYKKMHQKYKIELCASMGFLTAEQLHRLHQAGVTSYHHNIETSSNFFPKICTTHTYQMKIQTLKMVKDEGMYVCSGGIIGMGETWQDRIDMALALAEAEADSIPINALMPIAGTPLQNMPPLTEQDILRTIALFRFINPTADIRLAAGRALVKEDGKAAFLAGASATITGNMLTTAAKSTIKSDRKMLVELGRTVKELPQTP